MCCVLCVVRCVSHFSLLTVDPISYIVARGRGTVREIDTEGKLKSPRDLLPTSRLIYIFYRRKLQFIRLLFDSKRVLSMQTS